MATKRILSIISSIVKYVFEKINRELLEIEEYSFGYLLMLLGKRKVVGMFINEFWQTEAINFEKKKKIVVKET